MPSDPLQELIDRYPEMRERVELASRSADGDFAELCEDLVEIARRVERARASADSNLEELQDLKRDLESEIRGGNLSGDSVRSARLDSGSPEPWAIGAKMPGRPSRADSMPSGDVCARSSRASSPTTTPSACAQRTVTGDRQMPEAVDVGSGKQLQSTSGSKTSGFGPPRTIRCSSSTPGATRTRRRWQVGPWCACTRELRGIE